MGQQGQRFFLIGQPARRGIAPPLEQRPTGEGWTHRLPEPGFAVAPGVAAETGMLRTFLEAMRRDLTAGRTPVRVTVVAIEESVEYLLSSHLDEVKEGDLDAAVVTLRGYLGALVEEADAVLDFGRVVVRAMVDRARGVAGREGVATARRCAKRRRRPAIS